MPSEPMTFEMFETWIARHGTDAARWPDPSLATDPQLAAWLAVEREWENDLGSLPPLSANFADSVVAAVSPERNIWWRDWRGAGVAAAVVAMLSVGFVGPSFMSPSEDEAWAELATDAGFADLYEWVEG